MGLIATVLDSGVMGYWSISVSGFVNGVRRETDLTWFRGAPTSIAALNWTDPFGPATAQLVIPAVSSMERLPGSDTWWAMPGVDVDVSYHITHSESADLVPDSTITWEGFISSLSFSGMSVTLECSGAMRILDHRVAPKIIFNRPYPYEWVIAKHFNNAEAVHPTRLAPMVMRWPDWWITVYRPTPNLPDYLVPGGVQEGAPWTALTVREFGRWDEVLSSAIQGLLSVMFTEHGQFTLMLERGRVPVLRHRDRLSTDNDRTLIVDGAWPGVGLELKQDGSMTANAVYGEARAAISGASYKGLQYSMDGSSSKYNPFAVHGSVDPTSSLRDHSVIRKELYINFSDGLWPAEAIAKARDHVMRNAGPGEVGTINLTGVDPLMRHPDGEMVPYPSMAIQAGDTIRVLGLHGLERGVLFAVSAVQANPQESSVSLTVDTKFRDFMTVREVLDRSRDALRPWHLMTVGKYNINIPDAMMRWNYSEGSGYIPYESFTGGFWDGAPEWMGFPWEEWTRTRPPSHATWTRCYMKVPGIVRQPEGHVNAKDNWNRPQWTEHKDNCIVLLAQAGDIALLQIAAYDAMGEVKKVPFHLSIWMSNMASAESTPKLHEDLEVAYTDYENKVHTLKYIQLKDGAPYPFFEDAWETFRSDGSQGKWQTDLVPTEDGLLIGYGNHWEKAGYWPDTGRSDITDLTNPGSPGSTPAKPTGMLVDESGFSFDLSNWSGFSLTENNPLATFANASILVYCESDTDTYFLGRLFRKEYGA